MFLEMFIVVSKLCDLSLLLLEMTQVVISTKGEISQVLSFLILFV